MNLPRSFTAVMAHSFVLLLLLLLFISAYVTTVLCLQDSGETAQKHAAEQNAPGCGCESLNRAAVTPVPGEGTEHGAASEEPAVKYSREANEKLSEGDEKVTHSHVSTEQEGE